MKRLLLGILLLSGLMASGQSKGYLRYDSTYIMKQGGSNELILQNASRAIYGGLLTNVNGQGLTRFIRPRTNLDTLFIGTDTVIVGSTPQLFGKEDNRAGEDRLFSGTGIYGMQLDSMANYEIYSYAATKTAAFNLQGSSSVYMRYTNAAAVTSQVTVGDDAATMNIGTTGLEVVPDSIIHKPGGVTKLTVSTDTIRGRGPIRWDETKMIFKSSTTFPDIFEIRNTANDVPFNLHFSNGSKHLTYNMYGTDNLNTAFHWDYSPDRLVTPTRLLMGLRKNLFGFGDSIVLAFPRWTGGSEFNEEPPTSGHTYYWTNTHNLRSYRNGAYRSVMMNSTGYGVDTVYLNGAGDSLVFEIFGRRYAFLKGSGGGGVTPAALTKTDDANVTLTLGGTPTTALLQATSITVGWTGTLADSRITSAATWNAKQQAITVGAISGTNANGMVLSAGTLNATPADATNGGVWTNGSQTLPGTKAMLGALTIAGTTPPATAHALSFKHNGTTLGTIASNNNGTTTYDALQFQGSTIDMLAGSAGTTRTFYITTAGQVAIRNSTTANALLHIGAGTATANTAPLKFTSGTLLTTAEAGAVEFLTDKAYLGITTGPTRKEFTLNDAALTSGSVPIATTNGRLTDGFIPANGTVTPTSTDVNVASKTWKQLHYSRMGNRVTFSGTVLVAATGAGVVTLTFAAPIVSAFTVTDDASAPGSDGDASNVGVYVDALNATGNLVLHFTAANTGSHPIYFSGMYIIK